MRPGPDWFILVETLGIFSFAVKAMIVAQANGLSALGVFICAFAASMGGGTLRDILLGPAAQPFFWVAFPFYLVAIFVAAMAYAKLAFVQSLIGKRDYWIKETAELLALASLGALGAAKAYGLLSPSTAPGILGAGHLLILCSLFGAMTAAFGSILRDVLMDTFPGALRPGVGTLEALFVGSAALTALRMAGVPAPWAALAGFAVIVAIRAPRIVAARPNPA